MRAETAKKGTEHVTSYVARMINQSVFGEGKYVLNLYEKFPATIVSNNEVTIGSGAGLINGCFFFNEKNEVDSLAIGNGTQGMLRKDLIVARYTIDTSGNEEVSAVVIQGTPAASSPETPAYYEGDIQDGDTQVDFPLYEVLVNGITLESVTSLFEVSDHIWNLVNRIHSGTTEPTDDIGQDGDIYIRLLTE